MDPKRLAPLFIVTAVLHGASLVTRFTDVAAELPDFLPWAILLSTVPVVFVASYFEAHLDYGDTLDSLPLWMRIKSKPVKISFTLAFTYLAVVVLQTWDINIGPINPTPPPEWGLQQRVQFFAIMTVGMFFPFYLAATSLLIPPLRKLVRLFDRLPKPAALGAISVLGVGAGVGIVTLLQNVAATQLVSGANETIDRSWGLTLAFTLGLIFVPMITGWILEKTKS